jgi:sugar phosphate isomerase/epimerase
MAITGLSCADYAWPLLEHSHVMRHIADMGFEAVDIGFFAGRSHIRPEVVRHDVPWWAGCIQERLSQDSLQCADVFFAPATHDLRIMAANSPDPEDNEAGRAFFLAAVAFASRIGAPGISMNSGMEFSGESTEVSLARSAEGLRWRIDKAAERGLKVSIEGCVGTNTDTPSKLGRILELLPELSLTLDYTHYVSQGFDEVELDALLSRSRHIHIRGGAKGRMQTSFSDNQIDYARVMRATREHAYDGFVGVEYVWTELWDCDETENTMETIQFRDFLRRALEQPEPGTTSA